MPIFKHNGIELNYIIEGEGEPLLLIQGLGCKLNSYQYQIDFFKDKMKVIALDNRGVGKSSRPNYPYTMEMLIEDIDNLLDHLSIQEKIHLVGYSFGGAIVQNYFLKRPERVKTLILIATSAYTDPTPIVDFVKEMEPLSPEERMESIISFCFSRAFKKKVREDQTVLDSIKNDIMIIAPLNDPGLVEDYINQSKAFKTHDTRESLDLIKVPTLIIAGEKDKIQSPIFARFLHEGILNSQLEVIKQQGHGLIIEASEEVNEIMWKFLQKNSG